MIYRDGPIWAWLKERRLLGVTCVPLSAATRFQFWHDGRLRRVPPLDFLRVLRVSRRHDVPVDQSFRAWASKLVGEEAAEMGAAASGASTMTPARCRQRVCGGAAVSGLLHPAQGLLSSGQLGSDVRGAWGVRPPAWGDHRGRIQSEFHWPGDHHCRDRAGVGPGAAGRRLGVVLRSHCTS